MPSKRREVPPHLAALVADADADYLRLKEQGRPYMAHQFRLDYEKAIHPTTTAERYRWWLTCCTPPMNRGPERRHARTVARKLRGQEAYDAEVARNPSPSGTERARELVERYASKPKASA